LDRIVDAVKRTVDACHPELAADLVDQGLVLAGGGALLRGLDRFLLEQTGLPARMSPMALEAVARGALVCLEDLPQWRSALESSDDDV
jgi:rod shape-determining protein MreB